MSLLKKIRRRIYKKVKQVDAVYASIILLFMIVIVVVLASHFNVEISFSENEISVLRENSYSLEKMVFLEEIMPLLSEKRFILLGEATHGTQEFYEWRSILTKELIESGIIDFVSVEGDWDAIFKVNLYVKGLGDNENVDANYILSSFDRWPEWMWANEVFLELVEWIREYNSDRDLSDRIGVYGVDVYGAANSFRELMSFVFVHEELLSNQIIESANALFACFSRFDYDFHSYASLVTPDLSCEEYSEQFSYLMLSYDLSSIDEDNLVFEFFNAQISSAIVKNAENHFRLMRDGGARSWNARAGSFAETMNEISKFYGRGAGVLWAHNTHVGDARHTSMVDSGSVNSGQILRENYNYEVFILGFGTYRGTVIAGNEWGSSPTKMSIPNSPSRSYEAIFVSDGIEDVFYIFNRYPELDEMLSERNRHRAIGVVYNPFFDNSRNQVDTVLSKRYDAFVFIKETEALKILS